MRAFRAWMCFSRLLHDLGPVRCTCQLRCECTLNHPNVSLATAPRTINKPCLMFKPTVIDQFTDHVHTPLARWSDLHTHSRCASGFERLGFSPRFLCAAVSYFWAQCVDARQQWWTCRRHTNCQPVLGILQGCLSSRGPCKEGGERGDVPADLCVRCVCAPLRDMRVCTSCHGTLLH